MSPSQDSSDNRMGGRGEVPRARSKIVELTIGSPKQDSRINRRGRRGEPLGALNKTVVLAVGAKHRKQKTKGGKK